MYFKQKKHGTRLLVASALLTLLAVPFLVGAFQSELKYQDRGDRHEGINKGSPVSNRAELISARVDYNEVSKQIPDQYRLKFYLSQQVPVFVRVREIDSQYNYWMDKLKPRTGWHQGFDNDFQWPTDLVIKRKAIKLSDLGVVAQLDTDNQSLDMKVAPVILYGSKVPRAISGYSFTFKIGRKADVTCSFSKDDDNSPVLSSQSSKMLGQRPNTVNWKPTNAGEGWYRLTIKIVYGNNNGTVEQLVHFYHRPTIR